MRSVIDDASVLASFLSPHPARIVHLALDTKWTPARVRRAAAELRKMGVTTVVNKDKHTIRVHPGDMARCVEVAESPAD